MLTAPEHIWIGRCSWHGQHFHRHVNHPVSTTSSCQPNIIIKELGSVTVRESVNLGLKRLSGFKVHWINGSFMFICSFVKLIESRITKSLIPASLNHVFVVSRIRWLIEIVPILELLLHCFVESVIAWFIFSSIQWVVAAWMRWFIDILNHWWINDW